MSWLGIPFKLMEGGNIEELFLKISSLPKLTIDTPTDYKQLILTVGATFLGGVIPALIAWRTFYVNAKNVEKERREQQRFLKAERSKQQIFMMGEKASQLSSLREEREMQISISQKTINAQVISANRQNWINELRVNIASFCALAFSYFNAQSDYLIKTHKFEKISELFNQANADGKIAMDKTINELINEHQSALRDVREKHIEIERNKYIIVLMLNEKEKETQAISATMQDIILATISMRSDEHGEVLMRQEKYKQLIKNVNCLIEHSRAVLKNEWERVKSGQ